MLKTVHISILNNDVMIYTLGNYWQLIIIYTKHLNWRFICKFSYKKKHWNFFLNALWYFYHYMKKVASFLTRKQNAISSWRHFNTIIIVLKRLVLDKIFANNDDDTPVVLATTHRKMYCSANMYTYYPYDAIVTDNCRMTSSHFQVI